MDETFKSQALNQISYGLYVIGSKAGEDLNGMTANWVTQVSFEPPLVAISIENDSHTRKLIDQDKVFSVNIIEDNDRGQELIELFVKPQKPYRNKLGEVEYRVEATGAPVLNEALGWWECQVINTIETGDHQLYIGKVINAGINKAEGNPLTLLKLGWHYGG